MLRTKRAAEHRRVSVLLGYSVVVALVIDLIAGPILGAYPDVGSNFWKLWPEFALICFAVALLAATLQSLIGPLGTLLTVIIVVFFGNPSTGGGNGAAYLPPFWQDIGVVLPPRNGLYLIRNTLYFHGNSLTQPLIVLGIYVVVGAALVIFFSWGNVLWWRGGKGGGRSHPKASAQRRRRNRRDTAGLRAHASFFAQRGHFWTAAERTRGFLVGRPPSNKVPANRMFPTSPNLDVRRWPLPFSALPSSAPARRLQVWRERAARFDRCRRVRPAGRGRSRASWWPGEGSRRARHRSARSPRSSAREVSSVPPSVAASTSALLHADHAPLPRCFPQRLVGRRPREGGTRRRPTRVTGWTTSSRSAGWSRQPSFRSGSSWRARARWPVASC